MIKLQWLRINKFRRVKPGTLLTFNPDYNVLLGQNGTGKTTLLSLITAICRCSFSTFIDEEFDLEYELSLDGTKLRASVRNENRESALSGNMGSSAHLLDSFLAGANPSRIEFSADISIQPYWIPKLILNLKVKGSEASIQVDGATTTVSFMVDAPAKNAAIIPLCFGTGLQKWEEAGAPGLKSAEGRDNIDRLYQFGVALFLTFPQRFDESLEFYSKLGSGDISIHFSEQGNVASPSSYFQLPTSVLNNLADSVRSNRGAVRHVIPGRKLPFLENLASLMGFESAELVLEFEQINQPPNGWTHLDSGTQKFYFKHQGEWIISDKHLSFGQKRMLAFLYYLEFSEDVVVADELVNGLHHQWIQVCIEELRERQVFLTSQNPLLLDYLTFEAPDDVRSQFVLCRWEQGEQMIWENMSEEAAEDFFASYKVGFQQVGELLQLKGLW